MDRQRFARGVSWFSFGNLVYGAALCVVLVVLGIIMAATSSAVAGAGVVVAALLLLGMVGLRLHFKWKQLHSSEQ